MLIRDYVGFIPYYDEKGRNCTCVIKKDGSVEYFPCHLKLYIHKMFFALHIDMKARKSWITHSILDKSNHPLVINEELIFLPVKCRKSIGAQDGCYAYIHWQAIASLTSKSLILCNGITLPNLCKPSYIERKKKDALLLSHLYTLHHTKSRFTYKK